MTQSGLSSGGLGQSGSATDRACGFGRSKRLRSKAQITAVLAHSRPSTSGGLRLHTLPSENSPRLGVIAGRRAWPRAVDRNRFRRLVHETFRLLQHRLQTCDYVVRVPNPQRGKPDGAKIRNLFAAWIKKTESE